MLARNGFSDSPKLSKGRHRRELPVSNWLRISAATAGVGVALTAGAATAVADEGTGSAAASSVTRANRQDDSAGAAAAPSPRRRNPVANGGRDMTTANRSGSNKTRAASALINPAAVPSSPVGVQDGPDLPASIPAKNPLAAVDEPALGAVSVTAAVTAAPTARSATASFGTVYPSPVTAPVTVRAVVADTMNWVGLGAFTPGLPLPATPVPDLLAGLWTELRRLHYTLFNSYPTLSQSAPVQDPVTGILTGRVIGSDADQDVLTYHVGNASHGVVVIAPDGSYTYTPDDTFAGTDSFTVSVEDVTANPFHLYGGAAIVHNLLQSYAPGTQSSTNTTVIRINAPVDTATAVWSPGPTPVETPYPGNTTVTPLALYAPSYPAPVTAPVTVRSFATDPLNWFGSGSVAASVQIPAAPVGPILTAVWNAARKLHHTFFNSYPTLSAGTQSQDLTAGVVTGSLVGSDVDQNALTFHVGSAEHGTVVLAPDGTYTYTPDAEFGHLGGTDTFVASVEDVSANPFHFFGGWDIVHTLLQHITPFGLGNPDTKIITVDVAPGTVNAAPVVSAPTLTAASAATGAVGGSLVATDTDGDATTFRTQTGPSKGTVTVDAATGNFVYTPDATARRNAAAYNATEGDRTDTFTIAVTDAFGATTLRTVTVEIAPSNSAPTLNTTTFSTPHSGTGATAFTVVATDPDGDTPTVVISTGPTYGTLTAGQNGEYVYTPNAVARHNAAASPQNDTFTITATDASGETVRRTVTVAIDPANAAPTVDSTVLSTPNGSGTITATLSASDSDGDSLTYAVASGPSNGTVTIVPSSGQISYVPDATARHNAAAGQLNDTFTVVVSDGHGGTATRTITVPVSPSNTAPTLSLTSVGNPNGGNGAVGGTVAGADADADVLTYTLTTGAVNGTVSVNPANGAFVYTPTATARHIAATAQSSGGNGLQSITLSDPAAVTQGTFASTPTGLTSVNQLSATGATRYYVATFFTAANTQNYVFGQTSAPADTVMVLYDGTFDPGSPRTNAIALNDDTTAQAHAAVGATVISCGGSAQCPQVSANLTAGQTIALVVTTWSANVTLGLPQTFYASGAGTFSAGAPTDAFDISVSDGHGGSSTVRVTVPINAANAIPTFSAPTFSTPNAGSGATTATINASDADGDTVTYAVATGPTNGTLIAGQNAGEYVYTPTAIARHNAAAAQLNDTFTLTFNDGHGGTGQQTVTVAVDPFNTTPTVGAPTLSGPAVNGAISGNLSAADADGDTTVVTAVTTPTYGTVTVTNPNTGAFIYTPTASARHTVSAGQTDTFTLAVSDGHGGTVQQTVTVTVDRVAVNTAPTATVNTASTFTNGNFATNLTGWTAINSRVVLGVDSVGGWLTPADPTTAPDGGIEATGTPSATYSSTVTNGRAVMQSNMNGVVNTPVGSGGVVHGPVIVSDNPVFIQSGATVQFDWEASGGSDAFDVVAYMLNVNTGATYVMLNATGVDANTVQPTTVVNFPVTTSGNYKFVFVSGTWDATRGSAAGAQLSIDNVQILNNTSVGVTRGLISASDANGDPLTYTLSTGPSHGTVSLDTGTGSFSYTANDPQNPVADSFSITVDDGFGGTVIVPVNV